MKHPVHGFVSKHGELLPRWREAFPEAVVVAAGSPGKVSRGGTPNLLWLHLQSGQSAQAQISALKQNFRDVAIVVLSDTPSDEEALACFSVGAKGYANSHATSDTLRRVADVILQGGLWIGETLMQRLLQGTARIPAAPGDGSPPDWAALLTERERQVALAVSEGASNKEIARQLGITERTIKAHTGAIFEKLGVRDRMQLSLLVHGRRSR